MKYYHEKCKQQPLVCEKVCGSENDSYFFGNTLILFPIIV